MPAQNRVAAALNVVSILALFAFIFLVPSALAEGLGEAAPENPSAPAEARMESPPRVAQAPSGDGRPATVGDIRWQDGRNDQRWNDMRAETRALRAELSSFKDTVILLLGGLLASHLALLGVALVALLRSREKSPETDKPSKPTLAPAH